MIKIEAHIMMEIKKSIAAIMGWEIKDFDLFRSGTKGGRPNWEIERRGEKNHKRFAFTAFDKDDIYGLHEVARNY